MTSTPTNFVEVVVRERFWDWNCNFNTASFCWSWCPEDVLFWCIGRVTSFKSQMIFIFQNGNLRYFEGHGWVGMIWILFCVLVIVQRMQWNSCGFSNGSANKKKKKEGEEIMIVKDTIIFPKMAEVCESVWELFGENTKMDLDWIAGQRNGLPVYCVFEYIGSQAWLLKSVLLDVVIIKCSSDTQFWLSSAKSVVLLVQPFFLRLLLLII